MKRTALFILAILMSIVGGYLAIGHGQDDRSVSWHGRHLRVIEGQLLDLKDLLLDHRQKHGQFPTNDEGLAVLDNFEARFEAVVPRASNLSQRRTFGAHRAPFFWEMIQEKLRERRESSGRPVASAQGLWLAYPRGRPPDGEPPDSVTTVELAVTKRDNLLVLGPAGVLTPWMDPYLYENRRGHPSEAFRDSPARRDRKSRYSIRVAGDVWVYTLAGERCAMEYDQAWQSYHGPRLFGAGMILTAAVLVLLLPGRRWAVAGILAVLGAAGGAALTTRVLGYATCYIMSPLFSDRSPKVVARQRELLDKYRAAGVISDETYDKATSATEAAFAPPTIPEGESD